jgi:hypothetical protein
MSLEEQASCKARAKALFRVDLDCFVGDGAAVATLVGFDGDTDGNWVEGPSPHSPVLSITSAAAAGEHKGAAAGAAAEANSGTTSDARGAGEAGAAVRDGPGAGSAEGTEAGAEAAAGAEATSQGRGTATVTNCATMRSDYQPLALLVGVVSSSPQTVTGLLYDLLELMQLHQQQQEEEQQIEMNSSTVYQQKEPARTHATLLGALEVVLLENGTGQGDSGAEPRGGKLVRADSA